MQLLILSDIHGNMTALHAVLQDVSLRFQPEAVVLLGDNIDYGMRSNEVVDVLRNLKLPIICSLWGNHEYAILKQDYANFSSERGICSAQRTRSVLTKSTIAYLNEIEGKKGIQEFEFAGKKFLAVHGSLQEPLWGGLKADSDFHGYDTYDYVLSGHTHYAHCFPIFYESDNSNYRNKKKTIFMNPGSVGQPRNHDPRAQYAVLDFDHGMYLCGVEYDIELEQSLFTDEIDSFYRERLALGI